MGTASVVGVALSAAVFLATSGCTLLPIIPDRHALETLRDDEFLVGAWLGSWPSDDETVIADFERETGVRLDLVDVYLDWYTPFENVSHTVQHVMRKGAVPILTWEAHGFTTVDLVQGTKTTSLRDGRSLTLDAYLDEFAKGVCRVAKVNAMPVFMRILHEMNGGWFSWGSSYQQDGNRPNTDATYKQAWIKIWDRFDRECGDRVYFVWAVNHFSEGEGSTFTGTYPGDAYVDFVGMDGYNWGGHAPWGWQSFETIFNEVYCAITASIEKPILINEVASTENGGDKAAWIRDMYRQVERYSEIRGIVWFNYAKYEVEIDGNMDWHVGSSPQALEAFSEGAQELRQSDPGGPAGGSRAPC